MILVWFKWSWLKECQLFVYLSIFCFLCGFSVVPRNSICSCLTSSQTVVHIEKNLKLQDSISRPLPYWCHSMSSLFFLWKYTVIDLRQLLSNILNDKSELYVRMPVLLALVYLCTLLYCHVKLLVLCIYRFITVSGHYFAQIHKSFGWKKPCILWMRWRHFKRQHV